MLTVTVAGRVPLPRASLLVAFSLVLAACGGGSATDAGRDAGSRDAGAADAGAVDARSQDAGATDGAAPDVGACPDRDGDGHRDARCGGDDCDDNDPNRYPGNTEVCDAAGHDEDCNPATLGPDGDGDGFVSTACCDAQTDGTLLCGTDCDDTRATVNPSAVESCNGIDDDCDGMVDEGVLSTFYPDCDGDGFGVDGASDAMACTAPATPPAVCGGTGGWSMMAGDCDDRQSGRNPGVPEVCDLIPDNDCNPATNPFDMDGDGHDDASCGGDDCNDHDPTVYSGAPELCDRKDNACAFGGGVAVSEDYDNDGFAPVGAACSGGPLPRLDCNDNNAAVHPGATEVCNGIDDDCNGMVDEDPAATASCNETGTVGACVMGGCTIAMCTGTYANCDGLTSNGCEADLDSDAAHCGACGNACPTGGPCTSGTCGCPASQPMVCGGACVDTTSDTANCGGCGSACPAGATCSGGTCHCALGYLVCSGACVDPMADTNNCGGCGQTCTGGSCAGGACMCPGAEGTLCSGTCHDLSVDLGNCGACGAGCGGGSCAGGSCTCPPTAPTLCSGACSDTITDPSHCGSCTHDCGAGGACTSSTCDDVVAIRGGGGFSATRSDSGAAAWGETNLNAIAIATSGVAKAVGPAILHTDGTLFLSGVGTYPGTTYSNVVGVAWAYLSAHGCFVLATGGVECWGDNSSGQIGNGVVGGRANTPVPATGVTNAISVAVGDMNSLALLSDGTIVWWGDTSVPTPTAVSGVSGAAAIATNGFDSFAVLSDGTLLCWGTPTEPGCGSGTGTMQSVSGLTNVVGVDAKGQDVCAWDSAGDAWCWGDNTYSQVLGGSGTVISAPLAIPGFTTVRGVALSDTGQSTCVLSADSSVQCWGASIGGTPSLSSA